MAKSPAEVLCKPKSMDAKKGKSDDDKDDKKGGPKRNALIDFIAKHKGGGEKAGGKAD